MAAIAFSKQTSQISTIVKTVSGHERVSSSEVASLSMYRPTSRKKTSFKPNLADELQVTLSGQDCATQTDESEIFEIKDLWETVDTMQQEADMLKKDTAFIRSSLLASFDARLEQKSIELYVQMNDKVHALEHTHKEAIEMMRRAFTQQLCNAIVFIDSYYSNERHTDVKQLEERTRQLSAKAHSSDETIKTLMERLTRYQDISAQQQSTERVQVITYDSDSDSENSAGNRNAFKKEKLKLESKHKKEIEGYTEKIEQLETQLKEAQSAVTSKDDALAYSKKKIDKLTTANEIYVRQFEQMKALSGEQNRAAMEQLLKTNKLESEKATAALNARNEQQHADAMRLQQLLQENDRLATELEQEREKCEAGHELLEDAERLKKNEARLQAEVDRLKHELNHAHESWEKKFAILQQSLYALKDESYLRQSLQRQSSVLHQATISYAYDTPSPIDTKQGRNSSSSDSRKLQPLPSIARQRTRSTPDFRSQVITPTHRNRRRDEDSIHDRENQITDHDEELPAGFLPLPSPFSNNRHLDHSED